MDIDTWCSAGGYFYYFSTYCRTNAKMRTYREKYYVVDAREINPRHSSKVRVDLSCDVFDLRTDDGIEQIRSINRITYYEHNLAEVNIDRFTKILYLRGKGDAFVLPSSDILVNIKDLFSGKIISSIARGRTGKVHPINRKMKTYFEDTEIKEFGTTTEGWVGDYDGDLDVEVLDKLSGLTLTRRAPSGKKQDSERENGSKKKKKGSSSSSEPKTTDAPSTSGESRQKMEKLKEIEDEYTSSSSKKREESDSGSETGSDSDSGPEPLKSITMEEEKNFENFDGSDPLVFKIEVDKKDPTKRLPSEDFESFKQVLKDNIKELDPFHKCAKKKTPKGGMKVNFKDITCFSVNIDFSFTDLKFLFVLEGDCVRAISFIYDKTPKACISMTCAMGTFQGLILL